MAKFSGTCEEPLVVILFFLGTCNLPLLLPPLDSESLLPRGFPLFSVFHIKTFGVLSFPSCGFI